MKNINFGKMMVGLAATVVVSTVAVASETTMPAKGDMACMNNNCKGHADCAGFGNASCAGANECKGHGILNADDKKACDKKGGKWTAKKS
jgi:hypothetical protein